MSGFPPTFSKSAGSVGARGGSRTEGDGSRSGSVDQIAGRDDESAPAQPDPTLGEVYQLRARIAEREEFRKKRVRPFTGYARGVRAKRGYRTALMATLIDQGGTFAGCSNRCNPLS